MLAKNVSEEIKQTIVRVCTGIEPAERGTNIKLANGKSSLESPIAFLVRIHRNCYDD